MPFDVYSDMISTRDVIERGLRAGDIGTVVERHSGPGVTEEGYSVEFFDMTGNTVTVVTLPASALRMPSSADDTVSVAPAGVRRESRDSSVLYWAGGAPSTSETRARQGRAGE